MGFRWVARQELRESKTGIYLWIVKQSFFPPIDDNKASHASFINGFVVSHLPILVCATKSSSRCLVHDKRPFTVLICRILHFALLTAAWEFFKRIFPAGFSRWAEKFPVIMHETKEHCDSLLPRLYRFFLFSCHGGNFCNSSTLMLVMKTFWGKSLARKIGRLSKKESRKMWRRKFCWTSCGKFLIRIAMSDNIWRDFKERTFVGKVDLKIVGKIR